MHQRNFQLNCGNVYGREGLFIPAGWAHQVTSAASDSEESEGLHAAVNTWFEPPDY